MSNLLPNIPPQPGLSYAKRLLFAALLPGVALTCLFVTAAYLYLTADTLGSGSKAPQHGAGIETLLLLVIYLPFIGGLTTQLVLAALVAITFVPWKRKDTAFLGGFASGLLGLLAGYAISKLLFGDMPIWPSDW